MTWEFATDSSPPKWLLRLPAATARMFWRNCSRCWPSAQWRALTPDMSQLISIITAASPEIRNRSLDAFCRTAAVAALIAEADALDRFRRESANLYERVRAQFFLYSIHRF